MVFGEHRSSGESLVDFSTWNTYLRHDSIRYIFVEANWDVGMVCRGYNCLRSPRGYPSGSLRPVIVFSRYSLFWLLEQSPVATLLHLLWSLAALCYVNLCLSLILRVILTDIYIFFTFSFRIYIWRIEYFLSLNILLYVLYIYICTYNILYIIYIYMYIKRKTRRNSKENIQFVDLWTS